MASAVEKDERDGKRLPIRQMLIDWLPVISAIVVLVRNIL